MAKEKKQFAPDALQRIRAIDLKVVALLGVQTNDADQQRLIGAEIDRLTDERARLTRLSEDEIARVDQLTDAAMADPKQVIRMKQLIRKLLGSACGP